MKVIQYLDNLSKTQLKSLPNVKSDLEKISFKRWNDILRILKDNNPKPLEDIQFIYHNEIDGIKYQNILECVPMGDRYKFYYTPICMGGNSNTKKLRLTIGIRVTLGKTVFAKDLQKAEEEQLPEPKEVLKAMEKTAPLAVQVLMRPVMPSEIQEANPTKKKRRRRRKHKSSKETK